MKRSVALGKIWEVLYSQTDADEERLPEICEQVLKQLELIGMTPPIAGSKADTAPGGYVRLWTIKWDEV